MRRRDTSSSFSLCESVILIVTMLFVKSKKKTESRWAYCCHICAFLKNMRKISHFEVLFPNLFRSLDKF